MASSSVPTRQHWVSTRLQVPPFSHIVPKHKATALPGACSYQGRTWLGWVLEMIHPFTDSSGISGIFFYSRISA